MRCFIKRHASRSLKSVEICNLAGTYRFIEAVMKRFFVVLAVIGSMLLVACASRTNKAAGGPNGDERITASGYTEGGCLLNLRLAAREKNVRLVPDDLQVETNMLMFFFPFMTEEGYHCSGSFTKREKRPSTKDPLYPID
ncbi:MAG: hypothetical protein CV081_08770 [Nitrospira sp. LK265]|nr:hypothetical protein [Nitrospira sp. LK265]